VTPPHYRDESVTLYAGDALDVLRTLPDNSADSVVTDPPAGIAFMGKAWDGAKGGREQWSAWLAAIMAEALRVTKPGGHALVWALPRTAHWTACGLEDAGWEIRDRITHLFGSGFPKSLDVGKAIDRAAGVEREVVGTKLTGTMAGQSGSLNAANGWKGGQEFVTAPATDAARQWDGWHTALKPAAEDWWLCRKPLEGTVAGNVTRWGVGALNIDACRVAGDVPATVQGQAASAGTIYGADQRNLREFVPNTAGRWPTNAVLDTAAAVQLDRETGVLTSGVLAAHHTRNPKEAGILGAYGSAEGERGYGDSGGASRFFPTFDPPDPLPAWRYEPKAPTFERPEVDGERHATVKPLDLIRWLARLITPPGGLILDCFAGSGTTGEAAVVEGFRAILIEREAAYLPLIVARLSKPIQPDLFGGVA
jgi:hypothetical protein